MNNTTDKIFEVSHKLNELGYTTSFLIAGRIKENYTLIAEKQKIVELGKTDGNKREEIIYLKLLISINSDETSYMMKIKEINNIGRGHGTIFSKNLQQLMQDVIQENSWEFSEF